MRSRAVSGVRGWPSTWRPTGRRRWSRRAWFATTSSFWIATSLECTGTTCAGWCASERPETGILMLTAAGTLEDVVEGLSLGADD